MSVRITPRALARRSKLALLSARRGVRHALTRGLAASEFWRRSYGSTWDARMARDLVEREGRITGPGALYLAQPFRIEEYGALDALIRLMLDRRDEVRVADVGCGSGLACFFIAANRDRYGGRVTYVGIDSSEDQLLMARVRNPWSFATFRTGGLYATGLEAHGYDIVLNWQVVNHVGRIDEGLTELARIARGVTYMIAYAFLDGEAFARRFGAGHEAEWADLAWAFDRDHVRRTIASLGLGQVWHRSADASFASALPPGSTAEHLLLCAKDLPIGRWEDMPFDGGWKERIASL